MDKNRFFNFSAQNREYVFDTINGNIYDSKNINGLVTNADEEKEQVIRKHVEILPSEWKDGKVLNKMSLSLAHTCNLCCTYCFADAGTYGVRAVMDVQTAKDSIDYFFKYATKHVKKYNINFIGGEPLTNLEVFFFSIDYINMKSKEVGIPVHYMITTNGTIMNEKILRYIIDNNIHVNFSIDGNKEIHDLNRKNIRGKGSFEEAIKTLKSFQKHNYYNMTARMTLTKPGVHSFRKDIKFLWDIGFYYIFIDIVKTNIQELAFDFAALDELRCQLKSLMDSDIYLKRIEEGKYIRNFLDVEHLIEKKIIKRECSYHNTNTLQFTPEGNLYKCTYTVGNKEHCCGNIYSELNWEKYASKFEIPNQCKVCWARRICGGGCGINRDDIQCEYARILTECALKHYVIEKQLEGENKNDEL